VLIINILVFISTYKLKIYKAIWISVRQFRFGVEWQKINFYLTFDLVVKMAILNENLNLIFFSESKK